MDVYLKNEKENETFHFPVNPFGIIVNRSKKYDTADIVDLGEFDISDKGKKIKELSFETLFPKEYDTYCRYIDVPEPSETIKKLEKWMEQQQPVRLLITDFDFNDLVIISSLNEEERAGESADKYISLNFRVWRELKIETLSTSKVITSTVKTVPLKNNRPTSKAVPKIHVVKYGDCLWNLAKKYYGNGAKWTEIYNKNKTIIGKNPNILKIGQKLVI